MIAAMKSSVAAEIALAGSITTASKPPEATDTTATYPAATSDDASEAAKQLVLAQETNWGRMLGQFKWVYALFSPLGGFLADRLSRRYTIAASLFVWSLVTFATGTVTSFQGLLWTRTLMGISEAFYIPAALALIADYHTGHTRSRAVSIHQMGIYCGMILGGFTGYAADWPAVGWRNAFKCIGLAGIIYAIPLVLIVCDVTQRSTNDKDQADASEGSSWLQSLRQLVSIPSFWLLVAYFTLPALAGWVIRDWMPSILKDNFKISQGLAGVSATVYWQIAAIGAAIVGGWLADRWMQRSRRGRIYVSALGMGLIIPALLLVGMATSGGKLSIAVMALVLFGIGWGFFDCNNMPILCQLVKPRLRATGYGLMNMVSIFFGGVADIYFGRLKGQQIPMIVIFGGFSAICLVSVILVLLIRPRPVQELSD
jgi:MFS family permease